MSKNLMTRLFLKIVEDPEKYLFVGLKKTAKSNFKEFVVGAMKRRKDFDWLCLVVRLAGLN